MKVLQTICDLTALSGGPSTCTHDLMQGLCDIGADVKLLTIACNDNRTHNLGVGSSWLMEVENDYRTPLCISNNLEKAMKDYDCDIYHANTIWLYQCHQTAKVARDKKKPYIISTHGMLYPTALAVKPWKKWPVMKLWLKKDLMKATCIHATCNQEMEYVRQWGYEGPIAVIPNPVVFPEYVRDFCKMSTVSEDNKKILGFLGRLDPIKKVENILYALSHIADDSRKDISFQIMGKYDDQYEQWLKDEVKRLHLEDCVEFVGFVSGKEKYDRLSRFSVLMVPSAQENFGMIVPEALICGTPVYASLGTPWSELNEYNAGWWRDNTPETITKVILDILLKSDSELRAMGANGRKLIEEKYEQHKVAQMMNDLYKWIGGEISQPDFVFLK